jgi:hypothetical protein
MKLKIMLNAATAFLTFTIFLISFGAIFLLNPRNPDHVPTGVWVFNLFFSAPISAACLIKTQLLTSLERYKSFSNILGIFGFFVLFVGLISIIVSSRLAIVGNSWNIDLIAFFISSLVLGIYLFGRKSE